MDDKSHEVPAPERMKTTKLPVLRGNIGNDDIQRHSTSIDASLEDVAHATLLLVCGLAGKQEGDRFNAIIGRGHAFIGLTPSGEQEIIGAETQAGDVLLHTASAEVDLDNHAAVLYLADSELNLACSSLYFTETSAATWLKQLVDLISGTSLVNNEKAILNSKGFSSDLLLHELFTRHRDSSTTAVSFTRDIEAKPVELSYAQLHRLSNQVASSLSAQGLYGSVIPVLLPQSLELYVALLGILKSGNIYCSMLPDTPADRIAFVCQDVKATCAFASADSLPSDVKHMSVSLDRQADYDAPKIVPEAIAYVMYTSGSTGQPKAVQITHRNASTSILAHDFIFEDTQFAKGDHFLQFANTTFDISIFEIFSCWARDMTLIAAHRPLLLSDLPRLLDKRQINYLELTPSVAGLLPRQDDPRFSTVKAFLSIGEMLTAQVLDNWAGKLYNAYGPTEATLHATVKQMNTTATLPSNIGVPLRSCSIAILDPQSKDVLPFGWLGELCIGGPQVARGYLNRPDLTSAAFIAHDLCDGMLYRTGDLARIVDGECFFVGRKQGDDQVKINGQRIELGEIACAIERMDGARRCAVIKHENQLFAFVVGQAGFQLAGRLPRDLKPILMMIEDLPTSSSGKLDNKKLKAMAEDYKKNNRQSDEGDMSEAETLVSQAVLDVVGTTVASDRSLAQYGVDSLGAIKIVMALQRNGQSCSVFDVLDADTISGIAQRLSLTEGQAQGQDHNKRELGTDVLVALQKRFVGCTFAPCSPIQEAMLAGNLSDPAGQLYYNPILLQLPIDDFEAFSKAWTALVARHSILRTGFTPSDDPAFEFVQVIHPASYEPLVDKSDESIEVAVGTHKARKLPADMAQPPLHALVLHDHVSIMLHHALYDAWSLELLLHDLQRLLANKSLEDAPQYADVQRQVSSKPLSAATAYWAQELQAYNCPPLPILAQCEPEENETLTTSSLSQMSLLSLDEKCAIAGISPQAIGQLAWSLLLEWYTGESSCFAITTSGRTLPVEGIERTVGPFINTYPCMLQVGSDETIGAALSSISRGNKLLSQHSLPYRDILKLSKTRKHPESLFIYQKTGADIDKLDIKVLEQGDRLEFKILLTMDRSPDGLHLRISARPGLVAPKAAKQLLQQFDHLLGVILNDTLAKVSILKNMPGDLSSITNICPVSAVTGRLDASFADIADRQPDKIALEFYDALDHSTKLTYRQLDQAACKLANVLQRQVLCEEAIAICLDKSIEMYAAMIAIHKLGCPYLALDPALPDERLKIVLEVTCTKHVMTSSSYATRFSDVHAVDVNQVLQSGGKDEFEPVREGQLAYVLMTSGTTGVPKGCAVTHSNVLSNISVLSNIYPHAVADRIMQFTSYSFDVSVFEIWFAWLNGLCLVSANRDLMLTDLTAALNAFKVTHVDMTPMAATLVKAAELPLVKCFILTGEAISRSIIHDWGASKRCYNAYGPTEATNVCTVKQLTTSKDYTSSIGPVLPNTSGFVLDEQLRPVPRFAQGELWVGGAQIIRGYVNNFERTSQSFVQHPQFGRIYKTGDVVRMLDDNSISFLGRKDSQVKVRGFRIELDEVTHALRRHCKVKDAATIVHDAALVSFVKLGATDSHDTVVAEIFDRVKQILPAYMVPAMILPLDKIPHTSSYKLDTRSLQQRLADIPDRQRFADSKTSDAHASWTESARSIAQVFSRVSGVPIADISPDTSLHKLGMDSISAIKVATIIKREGHGEITVSDIMIHQSPWQIGSILSHASEAESHESSEIPEAMTDRVLEDLSLSSAQVSHILPCTPLQEGLLLETLKSDSVHYVNHQILVLQDGIDSHRLKQACQDLVQHTPILRTCFGFTASSAFPCVQVCLQKTDIDWTSSSAEDAFEQHIRRTQSILDLSRPPLAFLEQQGQVHRLVISLHHALFDGWSMSLMLEDLSRWYAGHAIPNRPRLADAMRRIKRAAEPATERYWEMELAQYELTPFPCLSDTNENIQSITEHQFSLSLSVLDQRSRATSTPILAMLQAAWAILLKNLSGSDDICFANVVSGRTMAVDNLEELVAPLFNVLPLRTRFSSQESIASLLGQLQKANLEHLKAPHYSLRRIARSAGTVGSKMFDTILILQKPVHFEETQLYKALDDKGDSNYALMMEIVPHTKLDTINLRLTACNNIVSPSVAQELAVHFERLVDVISEGNASSPVTGLFQGPLALTVRVPTGKPTEELLYHAFLANCHGQPSSIALEFLHDSGRIESLTYGTLRDRVFAISWHLQRLKLGRSAPVVVMMDKSPEMYIAFLAILHAGLVYVPLDVQTPSERLEYILAELCPALILTNGDQAADSADKVGGCPKRTLNDWHREVQHQVHPARLSSSDLAYIIYTSGSTGRPKAVMVEHKAAVATIKSSKPILWATSQARWLQFAASTFDMSIYDMSVAFSLGLTLCAASKSLLLEDLTSVINKLEATHVDLTPSVAKTIRRADVPCVKMLFCIGESLAQSIIAEWQDLCLNTYGPTEAAMVCSSHHVCSTSLAHNIGHTFAHARLGIFAVDAVGPMTTLNLGELCIAGPQLSRGYLKDADKTSQAFFTYEGERFYRTGDLCRMLPDKQILFSGRKDNQTKLRGQRIELDEISSVLLQITKVKAAAAIVATTTEGVEQLVAFISAVPSSSQASLNAALCDSIADVGSILQDLEKKLPTYMIPTRIESLNFLPLGNAGKLDTRKLQALFLEASARDVHGVLDSRSFSESELVIRQVMAQVSGVEESRIERSSSIYQLGLDSLAAIQIVSVLKKKGKHIDVVDILQNPTTEKMAKKLDIATRSSANLTVDDKPYNQLCDIIMQERPDSVIAVPCTPVQDNMIAQFVRSDGSSYYNHILFGLESSLSVNDLLKAWTHVASHYDILRASIVAVGKRDCQYALVVPEEMHDFWTDTETTNVKVSVKQVIDELQQELLHNLSTPSFRLHLFRSQSEGNSLLFSAHHALFDGNSLSKFLVAVQNVLRDKSIPEVPPMSSSAKRLWQLYHGEYAESSATYWQAHLQGKSANPFPNLSNCQVEPQSLVTKRKFSVQSLQSERQSQGISLASLCMAAWAKILSAYTGESQVSFGVVLSGRLGLDLEDALYPCISTLPFSTVIQGSATDTLKTFADLYSSALARQHLALSKVSKEGAQLFDTIFVYQQNPDESCLSCDFWTLKQDFAKVEVPISLEVIPDRTDANLELVLTHSSKVPSQHAKILLRQMEAILGAILKHPESRMLDLESHVDLQLLSVIPPQIPEFPTEVSFLHEYVEKYARETPEACALEFVSQLSEKSQIWSYKALNEEANRLAWHLVGGKMPKKPIAVCFDKTPDAFIAILAILKTGSPFCCLDPTAPIERRKFIVENSESVFVLCGSSYREELSAAVSVQVLTLPIDLQKFATDNLDSQRMNMSQNDLSYVLYTSGSTGTPKGCCLSHKSIVQALYSFRYEFCGQFDTSSRFLAFAGLHFDVSILEQYFSWSIGARLCAAPKDVMLSDIPGTIQRFGITHIDLTPQLAMTLLPEEAPSLRVFITGGEMLKSEVVENWGDKDVLFNFYGPTEATIGCTALKQVRKGARPSNIGQQWKNCGSIVQAVLGEPKPALRGGLGDLFISGVQVGEGYMNLPEVTRKRFVFNELLNDKTYQTGDLVRLLEIDASFDFVGRADQQVKLRGQRIETGEIDSVIKKAHTNIKAAVTVVLKHQSQPKEHLVTWIEYEGSESASSITVIDEQLDRNILFDAAQSLLPVYMVPTYIIPVNRIKLTATNKVDQKELVRVYNEVPGKALPTFAMRHRAGKSKASVKVLNQVRGILKGMTDLEEAQITDNSSIFELGLDSVSVVGLARSLKQAGLLEASVALVMKAKTVQNIASALSGRSEFKTTGSAVQSFGHRHTQTAANLLNLGICDIEMVVPCTPLVEGLLVESMNAETKLHFNKFVIGTEHPLDIPRAQKTFDSLVAQVSVLRTRFCLVSDGIAQVVLADNSVGAFSDQKFPLGCKLCQLDEVDGRLILSIHHALYDGHSLQLIIKHFQRLYERPELQLALPAISPVIEEILSIDLERAKGFWTEQLQSAQAARFNRGRECASTENSLISKTSPHDLQTYCKANKCTTISIFQAAWALILRRLLGQDAVFGLVVSGRNLTVDGVDDVVYPTFNTLPMFVNTDGDPTDVVERSQELFSRATAHEHTPQRFIKKALGIPSDAPLMDSILVLQHGGHQHGSWSMTSQADDSSGFAIALDVTITTDNVRMLSKTTGISLAAKEVLVAVDEVLCQLLADTRIQVNLQRLDSTSIAVAPESEALQRTLGSNTLTGFAQTILSDVADLLDVADGEVGLDQSFFALGLDSIDMVKLSARLKHHQLNASVGTLMANASVSKLAAFVSRSQEEFIGNAPTDWRIMFRDLDDSDVEAILPISPIQQGMLTEDIAQGSLQYLNHSLFKLASNIDVDRLVQAWEQVIHSNPILRTTFHPVAHETHSFRFVQCVHAPEKLHIERSQIDDVVKAFEQYQRKVSSSVDTAVSPPLAFEIFDQDKQSYLAVSVHHALYDGISLDMTYLDVQEAYRSGATVSDRPPYRLLIEHVFRQSVASADFFWASYLRGSVPRLAKKALDPTKASKIRKRSNVKNQDLKRVARDLGVSLQSVIQSCFAKALMQRQNQADVIFGTIQAGRSFAADADRINGPCMNTVPLRAMVSPETTIGDLTYDMHLANIEMVPYIHASLRRIQKLAGKGPLFDSLLVIQNVPEIRTSFDLWTPVMDDSSVEFPLAVECEVGKNIEWTLACHEGFLEDPAQLLEALDVLLAETIKDTSSLVAKPHWFNASDRQQTKSRELDPQEQEIALAIAEVAKVALGDVSSDTSIFSLGLDSISAVELSKKLRKKNIAISVGNILRNPSVREMKGLQHLDQKKVKRKAEGFVVLQASQLASIAKQLDCQGHNIQRVLPCTATQAYFFAAWAKLSGRRYMSNFAFKVLGNTDAISRRWEQLVQRFGLFRTAFAVVDGNLCQVVLSHEVSVQPVFRTFDCPMQEALARYYASDDFVSPDLKRCPALFTFIEASGSTTLLLALHHVLYDAYSIALVLKALQEDDLDIIAYDEFATEYGHPADDCLDFWRTYLREVKPFTLTPQNTSFVGSVLESIGVRSPHLNQLDYFSPPFASTQLQNKAQRLGVTSQSLITAAIAQALGQQERKNEVVLGLYVAGRSLDIDNIDRLCGPTVNILPVRLDLTDTNLPAKVHQDLIQMNGAAQQTSIAQIHHAIGSSSPGGLIDVAVNVLPRGSAGPENGTSCGALENFGRLPDECIASIRKCYSTAFDKHYARFEQLDSHNKNCVNPAVDIEVEYASDGKSLCFGVFCTEAMYSTSQASELIDKIWALATA
ncbi:hypothetical protein BCR37DRAFT_415360 [Protomyces lactucae-debilis]|uniref:Carrier domain-containing protein n=1 Tax=Protomyces lactucae-debilis TaxID=2754530 RepID=A0A1Y2F225_PROLT|nr:uncharacterized protein BCR37DRAFT_415360 [Protomyces lactucae-debilis]ORY77005.1 hypothetical protein BCR37DRAFT_415360 [Protomyces lactucae-debilis]